MRAHVHAGPAGRAQQNLSRQRNPRSPHAVRPRQHPGRNRPQHLIAPRAPCRALDNLAMALRASRAHHVSPSPCARSPPFHADPSDPRPQALPPPSLRVRHPPRQARLSPGRIARRKARSDGRLNRALRRARKFPGVVPTACPHDLFRREDGARGSQLGSALINESARLIVIERQNTATETAALILPSVGTNYERHPKLQRFMLANDSTTVAVEVPIWLYAEDIAAIERRWGIELFPKAATAPSDGEARSITGHIDFLQIRNGAIHVLDYKPDATSGKPFAQLTLYALALSHLTGIPLFDFKCAWFNERQYGEFFPRTVLARNNAL